MYITLTDQQITTLDFSPFTSAWATIESEGIDEIFAEVDDFFDEFDEAFDQPRNDMVGGYIHALLTAHPGITQYCTPAALSFLASKIGVRVSRTDIVSPRVFADLRLAGKAPPAWLLESFPGTKEFDLVVCFDSEYGKDYRADVPEAFPKRCAA